MYVAPKGAQKILDSALAFALTTCGSILIIMGPAASGTAPLPRGGNVHADGPAPAGTRMVRSLWADLSERGSRAGKQVMDRNPLIPKGLYANRVLLAPLLLAPLLFSCSPASEPEQVLGQYIDAVNGHSVARAVALHADDAEFILPGQAPIRGIEAMTALMQWDSVMQSRIRFGEVERHGDTLIAGRGSEQNLWFRGIGLDSISYASGTRFVFEGTLIKGVYPANLLPESASELDARFGEFVIWASTHAPDDLALLLPDGLFRYDPEAAVTWLSLLDRYASREDSDTPLG